MNTKNHNFYLKIAVFPRYLLFLSPHVVKILINEGVLILCIKSYNVTLLQNIASQFACFQYDSLHADKINASVKVHFPNKIKHCLFVNEERKQVFLENEEWILLIPS